MKKTEHMGTVVQVKRRGAVVELKPGPHCTSAFACSCCGSIDPGQRRIIVRGRQLEEGDRVRVLLPACAGWLGPLVTLLLPLLLLGAGALVGWLAAGRTTAREAPILAGAACGFVLAIGVAVLVNRKLEGPGSVEVHRLSSGGPD
ncbi:MAG: SoxR reducing system RseC family protein [Candidatus Brocadiaceae bacterium]|jgi:hypothetical protein